MAAMAGGSAILAVEAYEISRRRNSISCGESVKMASAMYQPSGGGVKGGMAKS
jgi:hypothetical protein